MASSVYPYLANAWLADVVVTPCYTGVMFATPTEVNPLASEFSGVSYARAVTGFQFTTSTSRTIANIQALQWLALEDTSIAGFGVWNAPVGGDLLFYAQLDVVVNISGRQAYQLDVGELLLRV